MYIAEQYVRIHGQTFRKGERVTAPLAVESAKRLETLGAIRWEDDAPAQPVPVEIPAAIIAGEEDAETMEDTAYAIPQDIDVADGIISEPEKSAGAEKKAGKRRRKAE